MQQILKQLIELQKIDTQLLELESLKGDLPQQVSLLNKQLREAEEALEDKDKKLQSYRKEKGMLEIEIKALEGKQKKYQAQLFEVKTNREYDAVTQEIEAAKADVDNKESRLLELIDMEEEITNALEKTKEEIENLKDKLNGKNHELKKRLAQTEKKEISLRDKRENIIHRLNPRIRATYERILKAKNGLAVVPVIRNACGGCFKTLPPQKILEIRQMNRLCLCEVCGRILVWDENISEQSE